MARPLHAHGTVVTQKTAIDTPVWMTKGVPTAERRTIVTFITLIPVKTVTTTMVQTKLTTFLSTVVLLSPMDP